MPPSSLWLIGLWNLVFCQLFYNLLARNPEFLVLHHTTGIDLIIFVVVFSFLVPAILIALFSSFKSVRSRLRISLKPIQEFFATLGYLSLLIPVIFLFDPQVKRLFLAERYLSRNVILKTHPPIVFVVFDEFPLLSLLESEEKIDAGRFPNFAALSDDSTWYINATSISAETTKALPAILTGRLPQPGLLPFFLDYPDNLFSLLAPSYEMDVRETATDLCPARICGKGTDRNFLSRNEILYADLSLVFLHQILPGPISSMLPRIDEKWNNFWEDDAGSGVNPPPDIVQKKLRKKRAEYFRNFVSALSAPLGSHSGPDLHFLHVLLPHRPWIYTPTGEIHSKFSNNEFERYIWQVQFTDLLLGELVRELKNSERYEETLLVVVADHGVSFQPGISKRQVSEASFTDVASVPFFIRYPGQVRGKIDRSPAETVDILPTIADVLGIDLPWKSDGVPLQSESVWKRSSKTLLTAEGTRIVRSLEEFSAQRSVELKRRHQVNRPLTAAK